MSRMSSTGPENTTTGQPKTPPAFHGNKGKSSKHLKRPVSRERSTESAFDLLSDAHSNEEQPVSGRGSLIGTPGNITPRGPTPGDKSPSVGTPKQSSMANFESDVMKELTSLKQQEMEQLSPGAISLERSHSYDIPEEDEMSSGLRSLNIPIYVYDCPLTALTEITTSKQDKRVDIVQDFTYKDLSSVPSNNLVAMLRPSEGKNKFGTSRDLMLHCNSIYDMYFRCFVSGVFKSLLQNHYIDHVDVETAVDTICEESFVEEEITSYLRCLCGHFQEASTQDDHPRLLPGLSRSQKLLKELSRRGVPLCLEECKQKPGVYDSCPVSLILHQSILKKFGAILGMYFKQVPNSCNTYFYSTSSHDSQIFSKSDSNVDFDELGGSRRLTEDDIRALNSHRNSQDLDDSGSELFVHDTAGHDQLSIPSSSNDDMLSSLSGSDLFLGPEEEPPQTPLFLQLTCSIRDKSNLGSPMVGVPVKALPTCLGEISSAFYLESGGESLDPFSPSLCITLDLMCLTLPPEPDYSAMRTRRADSASRSSSVSSEDSHHSQDLEKRFPFFDIRSSVSRTISHGVDEDGLSCPSDPLKRLPKHQREAIDDIRERIVWLLQDEIVSALRHVKPVTVSMLKNVARHVTESEGHRSCICESIPLEFVFGAEQSLEKFVQEFEKFKFKGYCLNKVEDYYYVSVDASAEDQENGDDEEDWDEEEEEKPAEEADTEDVILNDESPPHDAAAVVPEVENGVDAEEAKKQVHGGSDNERDGGSPVGLSGVTEQTDCIEDEEQDNVLVEGSSTPGSLTPVDSRHDATVPVTSLVPDEDDSEAVLSTCSTPVQNRTATPSQSALPSTNESKDPEAQEHKPKEEDMKGASQSSDELRKGLKISPRFSEDESQTPKKRKSLEESKLTCKSDFWLILRISDNQVEIYFHTREQESNKLRINSTFYALYENAAVAVRETCFLVNQHMLLQDLHDTRLCHSLLVPESDEDIWKQEERGLSSSSPLSVYVNKRDHGGYPRVVQGGYRFAPGHFGCDDVWYTHLPIHPRLKSPGRQSTSTGLKALRTILDKFSVQNRRDMFVYQESSGSVFYIRLFESICVSDMGCSLEDMKHSNNPNHGEEMRSREDDMSSVASQAGSRCSSLLSLSYKGVGTEPEDDGESMQHNKPVQDLDSSFSGDFRRLGGLTNSQHVEESIVLTVFGVDKPGKEIKEDLLEVLKSRLDEATLEMITLLLLRNPNCLLTPADVQFIQPSQSIPLRVQYAIPERMSSCLHPLAFYLRQNLLQYVNMPKFAVSTPEHHFRDNCRKTVSGSRNIRYGKPIPDSNVFLYNRPQSAGGRGIACIWVSITDSEGNELTLYPCKPDSFSQDLWDPNNLEEVFNIEEVDPSSPLSHPSTLVENSSFVLFTIWERGAIDRRYLCQRLKEAFQFALMDLVIEYHLLPAPVSKVPDIFYPASPRNREPLSGQTSLTGSPLPGIGVSSLAHMSPQTPGSTGSSVSSHSMMQRNPSRSASFTHPLKKQQSLHKRTTSAGSIYPSAGVSTVFQFPSSGSGEVEGGHPVQPKRQLSYTSGVQAEMEGRPRALSESSGSQEGDTPRGRSRTSSGRSGTHGKRNLCRRASSPDVLVGAARLLVSNAENRNGSGDDGGAGSDTEDGSRNTNQAEDATKLAEPDTSQALATVESDAQQMQNIKTIQIPHPEDAADQFARPNVFSPPEVETYEVVTEQEFAEARLRAPSISGIDQQTLEKLRAKVKLTSAGTTPPTPQSDEVKVPLKDEPDLSERKSARTTPTTPSPVPEAGVMGPLELQPTQKPTWQDLEIRRRHEEEKRKERMLYESGEKGRLHPSYCGPAQELFTKAREIGLPSVHSHQGKLLTKYAVDFVLRDVVTLLGSLVPNLTVRVFRESPRPCNQQSDEVCSQCLLYTPVRTPLKVEEEESESSVDRPGRQATVGAGTPICYILMARNLFLWRYSVSVAGDSLSEDEEVQPPKGRDTQKFRPYDPKPKSSVLMRSENINLSSAQAGFVPRQTLLLFTVQDKELVTFTYNWSADMNQRLNTTLSRLIAWNNTRCHLTSCLLTQKMGLFHHSLFSHINEQDENKEYHPFCVPSNDRDLFTLVKQTVPPSSERESGVPKPVITTQPLVFDEILRDQVAPRTMSKAPYSQYRDPVKRHGAQLREIRGRAISLQESKLSELYLMWRQRPPHLPITDDLMDLMKQSARLIHYCNTPLLFHPQWRRHITGESTTHFSKVKEKDGDIPLDSDVNDKWHLNLQTAFLKQYIQYLQSLCFVLVQIRPHSPKPAKGRWRSRSAKRALAGVQQERQSNNLGATKSLAGRSYLQKTILGGIMFIELGFQECYFTVKVFALECSRLPAGQDVNDQMIRMFIDECTKFKDLMHLNSFSYDFHLRNAQSFLGGRQLIFHQGYSITDLLSSLMSYFPIPPSFARNHICRGERAVPCHPGISPARVYNYIFANSQTYDMKTLCITADTRDSLDKKVLLILSSRVVALHTDSLFAGGPGRWENNPFDVSVVATMKNPGEEDIVLLSFFVLMASRKDLFPKLTQEIGGSLRRYSLACPTRGEQQKYLTTETGKGSKVRFTVAGSPASSGSSGSVPLNELNIGSPPSPCANKPGHSSVFHRSASSPNFSSNLASESGLFLSHAQSEERLAHFKMSPDPVTGQSQDEALVRDQDVYISGFSGPRGERTINWDMRVLLEEFYKARDNLEYVVCKAQRNCHRDHLWHRLLIGETGDEGLEIAGKKPKKKSDVKKTGTDLAANWNSMKYVEDPEEQRELPSSYKLSFTEFKELLSVVTCSSLKDLDPRLMLPLSMNASWYRRLFRILMGKFSESLYRQSIYRLFVSSDSTSHFLAILNPKMLDMFVLIYVDEKENRTDVLAVYREPPPELSSPEPHIRDLDPQVLASHQHIEEIVNAICFHLWTDLLPT